MKKTGGKPGDRTSNLKEESWNWGHWKRDGSRPGGEAWVTAGSAHAYCSNSHEKMPCCCKGSWEEWGKDTVWTLWTFMSWWQGQPSLRVKTAWTVKNWSHRDSFKVFCHVWQQNKWGGSSRMQNWPIHSWFSCWVQVILIIVTEVWEELGFHPPPLPVLSMVPRTLCV